MADIVKQYNSSSYGYLNSNGVPKLYKVGFSDHKYSFPCVGDVIFAWNANVWNDCPQIKLPIKSGTAPTITKNGFTGKLYTVLNYSGTTGAGTQYSDTTKLSSTINIYAPNESLQSGAIAHVGITYPTTNRYNDNTNHSNLSIFNGNTAHIQNVDNSIYKNGVEFQNTIVFFVVSGSAGFNYSSRYYRKADGVLTIDRYLTTRVGTTQFTIPNDSKDYYIYTSIQSFSKAELDNISKTDYATVGNGIGVKFQEDVTLRIIGCYMSARGL